MIIYCDIDGTICETVDGDYFSSQPIAKNIEKINELYKDPRNVIVYWTARGGTSGRDWTSLTRKQLALWGCKYHRLRMDKPSYDIIYDDKAVRL
jgi:hypothetical protein